MRWPNALKHAEQFILSSATPSQLQLGMSVPKAVESSGWLFKSKPWRLVLSQMASSSDFAPRFFYSAVLSRAFSAGRATDSSPMTPMVASVPSTHYDDASITSSSAADRFQDAATRTQDKTPDMFYSILGTRDLSFMTGDIRKLIDSEHPLLKTVVQYYFSAEGKKIRPLLVLLMASATAPKAKGDCYAQEASKQTHAKTATDSGAADSNPASTKMPSNPHIKLAMITELIHTASLLHDDVIDDALLRRHQPAVQVEYGSKLAILGGDFLLSRASMALASLGNTRVVDLLAQVLGDLVEGEVMQMCGRTDALEALKRRWMQESGWRAIVNKDAEVSPWLEDQFGVYLQKTYLKTASLMAKSCQAAVVLHGEQSAAYERAAYDYGMHLGMAFQLIDDVLDYKPKSSTLGKPSDGSDLKLGLATAPVLFAAISNPELTALISGTFTGSQKQPAASVVRHVLSLVRDSQGLEQTQKLASWHANRAKQAVQGMPDSPAREAMCALAESVVSRVS